MLNLLNLRAKLVIMVFECCNYGFIVVKLIVVAKIFNQESLKIWYFTQKSVEINYVYAKNSHVRRSNTFTLKNL